MIKQTVTIIQLEVFKKKNHEVQKSLDWLANAYYKGSS